MVNNKNKKKEMALTVNDELIIETFCKGASDGEREMFLHTCKQTGLDPFTKQIYAVKRWNSKSGKEEIGVQTSIDGFRLIAERTGKYSPGKETDFSYNENGNLVSATAHIKKMTPDGTWHDISATAYFDEYVQKTKTGEPTQFWKKMPRVMLSKVAESVCLRKSFPCELSGIYTNEEMDQATHEELPSLDFPEELITNEQATALKTLLSQKDGLEKWILKFTKVDDIAKLPVSRFEGCLNWVKQQLTQKEVVNG